MGLPKAEQHLVELFGERYNDNEWRPALVAVMDAENDVAKALEAIRQLTKQKQPAVNSTPNSTVNHPKAPPLQLTSLENELTRIVQELKDRRRIVGAALTLEEMLNPAEEMVVGDSQYRFEGSDEEIVQLVQQEITVAKGEVMEVDSESEDEGEGEIEPEASIDDVIKLCQHMKGLCLQFGSNEKSLSLAQNLCQYCVDLKRVQSKVAKQVTLEFGRVHENSGWVQGLIHCHTMLLLSQNVTHSSIV
jgi:hypothetical protein